MTSTAEWMSGAERPDEHAVTSVEIIVPRMFNDRTFIPLDVKKVVDIGCGKGTMGALLRNYRPVEYLLGLDAFSPYLQHNAERRYYDDLMRFDLEKCESLPFKDDEFDLVLCLEVVEHLDKCRALRILSELGRIGRRVVVSTPSFDVPRHAMDGNPWQRHRCVITRKDFQSAGYKVYGAGPVRIPYISDLISVECQALSARCPRLMPTYIAVKNAERLAASTQRPSARELQRP